jgi:hypothetical protein
MTEEGLALNEALSDAEFLTDEELRLVEAIADEIAGRVVRGVGMPIWRRHWRAEFRRQKTDNLITNTHWTVEMLRTDLEERRRVPLGPRPTRRQRRFARSRLFLARG